MVAGAKEDKPRVTTLRHSFFFSPPLVRIVFGGKKKTKTKKRALNIHIYYADRNSDINLPHESKLFPLLAGEKVLPTEL